MINQQSKEPLSVNEKILLLVLGVSIMAQTGTGLSNLNYKSVGAGAVSVNAQAGLQTRTILASEYGVKANTGTDQLANINAATLAAYSAFSTGNNILQVPSVGYTVMLPKGDICVSGTLNNQPFIRLKGQGSWATVIHPCNSSFAINVPVVYQGGGNLDTTPAFQSTIEDLTIACGYSESSAPISGSIGYSGTQVEEQSGLDNVNIAGCQNTGVYFSGFGNQNSHVRNVHIFGWPTGWSSTAQCITVINNSDFTLDKYTCNGFTSGSTQVTGSAVNLTNVFGAYVSNGHVEEWNHNLQAAGGTVNAISLDCNQNCSGATIYIPSSGSYNTSLSWNQISNISVGAVQDANQTWPIVGADNFNRSSWGFINDNVGSAISYCSDDPGFPCTFGSLGTTPATNSQFNTQNLTLGSLTNNLTFGIIRHSIINSTILTNSGLTCHVGSGSTQGVDNIWVNDSSVTTFGATYTGGGNNTVTIGCNGTNWVVGY